MNSFYFLLFLNLHRLIHFRGRFSLKCISFKQRPPYFFAREKSAAQELNVRWVPKCRNDAPHSEYDFPTIRAWGKRVFALETLKKLKFSGNTRFPPHAKCRKSLFMMQTIIYYDSHPPRIWFLSCRIFP
jgi:hypothetical protein